MAALTYGPNDAQVRSFLERLGGATDAELWALEEEVGTPGPNPLDTRATAAAADRLLAWYEAGHYADLGPRLRRDGTLRQEYPGQGLVSSLARLRSAAVAVAQALVVRDLLGIAAFEAAVEAWPCAVDAWIESALPARLETAERSPRAGDGEPDGGGRRG